MEDMAPVTGIPMGIIQAALLVARFGMSLVLAHSLWRQATGRMRRDELVPTNARPAE
jgi:TRAP-type C4-dicarboxylate transport system permease small subunit